MDAEGVLDWAERILLESDAIDHWQKDRERIEAEELLAHALGRDFDLEDEIPLRVQAVFERYVRRRERGEPVQLITGVAEFRGLKLRVRPGTFIPRDSSEFLAVQAVRACKRRGARAVAVDMACGIGPVAFSIAKEVQGATVVGADLSREAIACARANARALGLPVRFVVSDLFSAVPKRLRGTVDVITLHPPYVAKRELRDLPDEIRLYEPKIVLTDGSDSGLGLVQATVAEAPVWLRPGGAVMVEVSPDRARSVMTVMRRGGLQNVRSTMDRGFKVTRVVIGRTPRGGARRR